MSVKDLFHIQINRPYGITCHFTDASPTCIQIRVAIKFRFMHFNFGPHENERLNEISSDMRNVVCLKKKKWSIATGRFVHEALLHEIVCR
jgi:hypothetical protein